MRSKKGAVAVAIVIGLIVAVALNIHTQRQHHAHALTAFVPPARTYPTIVAAGDIAACQPGTEATAKLIEKIRPNRVLTLGDNTYPSGTAEQYAACYQPTWGRFRDLTWPTPGNHDYGDPGGGAAGYRAYFNITGTNYTAHDIGGWRLYALDSENVSAEQIAWLQADLAANPRLCVLAYWHKPRYSDGPHGDDPSVDPLWQALVAAHADVVLVGHDHNYQRMPRINGIREFIVGTGGASHYGVTRTRAVFVADQSYGVLRMTLRPTGYTWSFRAAAGEPAVSDYGSSVCRSKRAS